MNRWKLVFEFDGTRYKGWQAQPDAQTVEGEIETAFSTFYQMPIDITGQGRTDAGVHAKAQVAHADLPETYSRSRILHAMRGLLPRDIALTEARKTDPNFHARHHATSRLYSYKVMHRYSPLNRNRVWCSHQKPDSRLLHICAEQVKGNHNFVNFCIPPGSANEPTHSTIYNSYWNKAGEIWTYYIEGERFLRHMVRRLAGSIVLVATGKMKISEFEYLLEGHKTDKKAHAAPAYGLYLESVSYKPVQKKTDNENA